MKHKLSLILIALFIFTISGCVNDSKKKAESIENQRMDSINRQRIDYLLPSPQELMSFVKDEGLTYKESLVYDLVDVEVINLYRNQALYFGVYFCDFYYLSAFEKNSQSLKYLSTLRQLSVKVGIDNLFRESYFKRMENNYSNLDSLKEISIELSFDVFNSLGQTDNQMVFSIIGIGSIVESIYLTSSSVTNFDKQTSIVSSVYDIGEFYENFFSSFLVFCSDNPSLKPLLDDLTSIRELLLKSKGSQETGIASKRVGSSGVNISLKEKKKEVIGEADFTELKNLVSKVRLKIVNQQY